MKYVCDFTYDVVSVTAGIGVSRLRFIQLRQLIIKANKWKRFKKQLFRGTSETLHRLSHDVSSR